MGNTNSSLEICFPAELVSRDGTFNFKRLSELAKDVKLPADGGHYTVVSIVGPQSSGKSTLMNHIFGTEFKEMDFKEGRNPTTKGIWVAGMKRAKGSILVIDTEGTDGEEREDDTSFESQTVAFVLAISDTVIINLMCSDIGHRLPVIKTLFEVKIRKFAISHKISLQFVLRDKTKTPLDKLREQLMQQLEKIWCKMTMPQAQIKTDLKDHFHIEVTTMSNYETDEIQFMNEAAMLGERIIHSSTTSQCGLGWASASEFLANASRLWDDIKNDKDLDLPSYSIMLAEVRCKQIFEEKYKSFLKDEEELRSRNVQQFGKKSNKLIASYLSKYDKETLYYDEAVRDGRREQLFEKLLEIKDATLEKCKKADYTDHFQRQLDNHFADFKIDHTNWNFKTEQRSKFEQDIKACLEKPEFDPLKDLGFYFFP